MRPTLPVSPRCWPPRCPLGEQVCPLAGRGRVTQAPTSVVVASISVRDGFSGRHTHGFPDERHPEVPVCRAEGSRVAPAGRLPRRPHPNRSVDAAIPGRSASPGWIGAGASPFEKRSPAFGRSSRLVGGGDSRIYAPGNVSHPGVGRARAPSLVSLPVLRPHWRDQRPTGSIARACVAREPGEDCPGWARLRAVHPAGGRRMSRRTVGVARSTK